MRDRHLAACAGPQSALDPAGPSAASIHRLGIVLWIGATLVTLLVVVLMLVPFLSRRERVVNRKLFLWGGGVALPAVTLTAARSVCHDGRAGNARGYAGRDRLSIDVTGALYWWEMSYRRGRRASRASRRRTNCACRSVNRSNCFFAQTTSSTVSGCRTSPGKST